MIKRLWIVAALFAMCMGAEVAYAGFGITPPYVRSDKLTQGSEYTQEIIIVRGDPVEDLKAELTINVPGIEDWISIDRGNEFLLPAGVKQVPIQVTIRVPQTAPYERYQGNIRIRTLSPDPASGVSIALGAQIDVDVRVVDEIRDFEVKRVQLSEAEEPRRVLWLEYPGRMTFTMGIENTGNAPTAPGRVQFDIYDKRGNVVLESTQNTNDLDEVLPFETRDVVAYLPTRLPPGAYLVKYSVFRFEDEVKRSGELTLSVLPQGTLAAYVGYGLDGLSLQDQLSLIIPVGLVVFGLLATILVVRLRRSNRSQRRSRSRRERDDETPPSTPPHRTPPARHQATAHGVVDLSSRRRKGQ